MSRWGVPKKSDHPAPTPAEGPVPATGGRVQAVAVGSVTVAGATTGGVRGEDGRS